MSLFLPSGIRPVTGISTIWESAFNYGIAHLCFRRFLGDTSMTRPQELSAQVLKHIHFSRRQPFERGLSLQEQLVRSHLDFKQLQGKISSKLAAVQAEHPGGVINPQERSIIDNILRMKPNPMVLTFEFEPTYTGGKRIKKTITPELVTKFENFVPEGQSGNMKKPTFIQLERGGEVTFHGPGQMVAYIVLDLKAFEDFPARKLVSVLEQATINTLRDCRPITNGEPKEPLALESRLTEKTGVWSVKGAKIASIGIHVRRSITSHGVSINVNTDLSYMTSFDMCGTPGGAHTSVQEQRPDVDIDVQTVAIQFVKEFAKLMGIDTVDTIQPDE